MTKYRVYLDLKNCTGTFSCVAAAPGLFVALPGGDKVDLTEGVTGDEPHLKYRDVEAPNLDAAVEAANVCGPQVIRVEDLESGITIAGPERLPIEQEGIRQERP